MKIKINSIANPKRVSKFKELKGYINNNNEFIMTGKNMKDKFTEVFYSYHSSLGMFYEKIMKKLFIEALRRYLASQYYIVSIKSQEYTKMVEIDGKKSHVDDIFVVIVNDRKPVLRFSINKNWIYGDTIDLTIYQLGEGISIETPKVSQHIKLRSNTIYKISKIERGHITITGRSPKDGE